MKEAVTAQVDARISERQKAFLEYAAGLGGYKTLAAFVFNAACLSRFARHAFGTVGGRQCL